MSASQHRPWWLLGLCAAALAAGLAAWYAGAGQIRDAAWIAAIAAALIATAASIVSSLRSGDLGVDVVALLALAGALVLDELLAGAVIALMIASGRALEGYAQGRARRELSALLARTPRIAHRYHDGQMADVPLEDLAVGDRLLVKGGEVVPVDGLVTDEPAVLDESALTGESVPVTRPPGEKVSSGAVNAGGPFHMHAIADAAGSTYAGVVRLVQNAQRHKAPFVRLADRYALLLVPLTLSVAGLAWLASGDATRALAVLVVATPCPLILAAPVALVAGMSRAAKRGILIKSGGALETLARARVLLLDKTGTLTLGAADVVGVESTGQLAVEEILRLAASLDQVSQHVSADAVTRAARARGLALALPARVLEQPGAGLRGEVQGREVVLGAPAYVVSRVQHADAEWLRHLTRRLAYDGSSVALVAVDGSVVGAIVLADRLRADAPRALRALRRSGIRRIVMVSGDRLDVAESIAAALGVDTVLAERAPEDKVDAVLAERPGGTTLMVGDGINDAPALAAADVGIAMGARGAAASTESADVVLLVDRLERVSEALRIAARSRRIALESVIAGMTLSAAAMGFAAVGLLAPVPGAFLQEAIDVAVILNALRALRAAPGERAARSLPRETAARLKHEHAELMPFIGRIRSLADRLADLSPEAASQELLSVDAYLRSHLLPHEREDEATVYPGIAEIVGGIDPMGTMSHTHREIAHLARLYHRLVADWSPNDPESAMLREVRRVLYALDAILRLHFAQEEELYESSVDDT